MVFPKAVVLILSVVSAVSAEFHPSTSDVGSAVKDKLQKFHGRRLQAAAMSDECKAACDGVEDFIKLYTSNMEAVSKGDWSWMCGSTDTAQCMGTKAACQDDGKAKESSDMDDVACMCTCPVIGRMDKMTEKDYCDPANSFDCVLATASCYKSKKSLLGGGSEADFTKGMSLHCQQMDLDCTKKMTDAGTCAGDSLTSWMAKGCEDAAKSGTLASKSSECCSNGEKVVKCMDAQCIKLQLLAGKLKAKDADAAEKIEAEAELKKTYEIGKVCTGTGMPTSDGDLAAADADNQSDESTSKAFASVLHTIPLVVMVVGLSA